MKKILSILGVLVLSIALAGCDKGNKDTVEYPIVEQLCIEYDGVITTDDFGNAICFFDEELGGCDLRSIEEGACTVLNAKKAADVCDNQGGEVQYRQEGGEDFEVCWYDDESFCYLEDLANGECKKGDMNYYDEPVDLYPYAEQACIDSNGQISETDEGKEICILENDDFCYIDDIRDGLCDSLSYTVDDVISDHEAEREYQEYIAECYDQEQITVCGNNGVTYYNRCFMEKDGVQEDTEAEIVDGECIFG